MPVQELIKFKNDLKESQLLTKVKDIVTAKIKELGGDLSQFKMHPEITEITLDLVYNLTNEFKLKTVDRDKMALDFLTLLFNLNPTEQTQIKTQIAYFIKNNKIKVYSSFEKFTIKTFNCIKKKVGL